MRRGKPKRPGAKLAKWSQNQKLQACMSYCMLGNLKETALVTSIPYETLKTWRYSDWFKDLMVQIRDEDVQQLDSNLQRVIDKALKATEERLDSGDHMFDPRTGKLLRIPVKANVALKITTELLTKQEKAREKPQRQEVEKTIDARLAKLSEEFARFATSKTIQNVPYTVIMEPAIPDPQPPKTNPTKEL